ncbi:ankyrin repeat and BTB/POZ domain-containing protein 2-like [Ctenocephalides felis]|uniref:ankyrin repeat and BTB/POZ domain-containing protein 2-like n=1 Tax=Ctenocephalides felis TaxID=7515 RepID=UPI000E6E14C7|nr:ankyrin repeat and BTB/POZ domain-containing protein 2-like [Ctenocephalides felis]
MNSTWPTGSPCRDSPLSPVRSPVCRGSASKTLGAPHQGSSLPQARPCRSQTLGVCITDADHEIVRPKPRRPSRSELTYSTTPTLVNNSSHHESPTQSGRVYMPATSGPACKIVKEVAEVPQAPQERSPSSAVPVTPTRGNDVMIPERDSGPGRALSSCQRAVLGPVRLAAHSGPVRSQPAFAESLERPNSHNNDVQQRARDYPSSSDENRSSGHASMSDTTGRASSSSPHSGLGVNTSGEQDFNNQQEQSLNAVPEDSRFSAGVTQRNNGRGQYGRPRHRVPNKAPPTAAPPWHGGSRVQDIQSALQQLTTRTSHSATSVGSESSSEALHNPAGGLLARHSSSLETVDTSATGADEFVWVDSHNRLVELHRAPWSARCIGRLIRHGRCRPHSDRLAPEAVPRLAQLLQRALVRIARESQRLAAALGFCSRHEIAAAMRIVLTPSLADSCIKACQRAAAMFAAPGDAGAPRRSKSSRAGLLLNIGKFQRWMTDVRLANFVHEYAAVYLCAGLENLIEESLLLCLPPQGAPPLTPVGLEQAVASRSELWGLLQPYAHLNAGRIANGTLSLPCGASSEPCLLTTCVGSARELTQLANRAQRPGCLPLGPCAIRALFYFMRCSQLENRTSGDQDLAHERAYAVLPPLGEWLRVAGTHAEHRHALSVDADDVLQAARLLLPGVDCPPRPLSLPEPIQAASTTADLSNEAARRACLHLAIQLLSSGRSEHIDQGLNLLPPQQRPKGLNVMDYEGRTALMLAVCREDDKAIQVLLDAGADIDMETPAPGPSFPGAHPVARYWTALTFACCLGRTSSAVILLERGACVEGGAGITEDRGALTPLQVACGSGHIDIVSLLLQHGANCFLSTLPTDTLCYSGSAQRGCYSAVSVAACHGKRATLLRLLRHPGAPARREVLSLQEMLAEGHQQMQQQQSASPTDTGGNKRRLRALQEAMYHSAENDHLDITMELRVLGAPWTLHSWTLSLSSAHEARSEGACSQLLRDFIQLLPEDKQQMQQLAQDCLPLLFAVFRAGKKESTMLLLADIFSTIYGKAPIPPIEEEPSNTGSKSASRIDPSFVNNPELSDVVFRVEGRIFYGHKIVLVTASPRLRAMLSSKISTSDGSPPTVQINDIRYGVFQLVMEYLYSGSGACLTQATAPRDLLELMAAASFFQLGPLLRYTEARCSALLDTENVVAMYIHSKVYNALHLLQYCQGYLLQNMVELLTYDDSVKRLLFAKKLPNHDALSGLLTTLQHRITAELEDPTSVWDYMTELTTTDLWKAT